ncbi:MAG: IS66 family transposase zinc-finger binding domain-containing protein [Rikenellaceae bacterium]
MQDRRKVIRKKKSGGVRDILLENLPVDVVEHRLSAEELSCPACGTEMVEIGKEVRRSLKIIPAQVRLQEDWYYTCACKKCEKEGTETPILNTPKEKTIIPGGFASPEAVL